MVGRPVMPPPPPYSSVALEGDQMVHDTTSKMNHTIDDIYPTMDEFHIQFTRLECTNQLLVSGFNRWIHNRGKALTKARHLIDSCYNQEEDAYIDLLDRMTSSVLHLLDEAHATLNRMVKTRRTKAPFTITTAIDSLGTRLKTRSKLPPPAFVLDQSSRYQTSQKKLNLTFALLLDQVNSGYAKKENRRQSAVYYAPTQSPKSIRRSSLPPPPLTPSSPSPALEKHDYRYGNDHHHFDEYSPPPSPLPRQTMELSYWALYGSNNSDEDEELEDEEEDDASWDSNVTQGPDTILTTATSRSVKLVHSCLSPLLRLASPSKYSPSEEKNYSPALPPLSSSTSSSSLVSATTTSSSSSYSLSSLASSSSLHHTTPTSNIQLSRCKQLYRIAFNALVISRLLLHRHHHPSSTFNSNLHLLRPQHQHLWRQYLLVVFGTSPSISPLPYMCEQLPRLFFLIQLIYRISS